MKGPSALPTSNGCGHDAFMRERRADTDGAQLVAECEAFLAGTYAEYVESLGGRVPGWAWANLLAHGSVDDLRATAALLHFARAVHPGGGWRAARAYLAAEVVGLVDGGACSLRDVQEQVLVPVELVLASDPSWPGTPTAFVTVVRAALRTGPRVDDDF